LRDEDTDLNGAEAAKKRPHHNVLAIALALARIAWAVLNKGRALSC
jgi:transposase